MSNSNHSAKFINMLIALMASIAIALTCIVPTALAEDGDGTDDNNNGGSTVQPAGPEHHHHQLHLWRRFRGGRHEFRSWLHLPEYGQGGGRQYGRDR